MSEEIPDEIFSEYIALQKRYLIEELIAKDILSMDSTARQFAPGIIGICHWLLLMPTEQSSYVENIRLYREHFANVDARSYE